MIDISPPYPKIFFGLLYKNLINLNSLRMYHYEASESFPIKILHQFGDEKRGGNMKKMGDYMREIGFNDEASFAAKKAFLKYLMREASSLDRVTPIDKFREVSVSDVCDEGSTKNEQVQLSLFDKTGSEE